MARYLTVALLAVACTVQGEIGKDDQQAQQAGADTGASETPTDLGTGDDTDTAAPGTTAPLDCSTIPKGILPFTILEDFGGAEDFDFDAAGNHVAVSNGSLVARPKAGGPPTILAAGLASPINGLRALPNGDFVFADDGTSSLRRISPDGVQEVLMGSINYPNGVDVTRDGKYAFVTENANPGELYQVDLETLETYRLFTGIQGANGIAISADEQKLYVGTCAGTGIVALDRISDTEWTEPRIIVDHPWGCYDAMNIDACGNLYFWETELRRMLPDEKTFEIVGDDFGSGFVWLPNARWGNGLGGWDSNTLYINNRMSQGIIALEVGLPGKPHVHAP